MSNVEIYHDKPLSVDLIKETFEASFNIKFDKEYWEWRFLNNPNSNKTYISYIIEDGILAAYYAVSPMKIIIEDKEEKIALSNMTMTHPDYRGRGYFTKLAQSLFNDLKNENFVGVFGFANHNSHYGFRKHLNWVDLSVLNLFRVKPDSFRNIKVQENSVIITLEKITDEILNSLSFLTVVESSNTQIKRSKENIEWRLKKNPTNIYKAQGGRLNNKIVSVLFYKVYHTEIDIMEFFYSEELNKTDLQNYCISTLIKTKNSTINMWSNLHSEEHINLEKQGFQETEFNTYFGVIPFTDNKALLDYKKWHYRFIDSDIF